MNENVVFTITIEDESISFDINLVALIDIEPYEPADRHYPGTPGGSTVTNVEIVGHPDQASVISYINQVGGTYQDFVEEDHESGILFDLHRDKGVVIDSFNGDAVLEYLRGEA